MARGKLQMITETKERKTGYKEGHFFEKRNTVRIPRQARYNMGKKISGILHRIICMDEGMQDYRIHRLQE